MKATKVSPSQHLFITPERGESLVESLQTALAQAQVQGGYLRGGGILEDVTLVTLDATERRLGAPRLIQGRVHAVSVETALGPSSGSPSFSLRAVLARQTDAGLQTLAGELRSARVVAFEAHVAVADPSELSRQRDDESGLAFVEVFPAKTGDSRGTGAPGTSLTSPSAVGPSVPSAPVQWADAVQASHQASHQASFQATQSPPRSEMAKPAPKPSGTTGSSGLGALPQRPHRSPVASEETVVPEEGDIVEHFAFGRVDVVKSDGDRLHVRAGSEGRVREIAIEMLRVIPLPPEGERRRFKLERKL